MPHSAVVIREDEFGGLDWLGLPGQDPELVQNLIDLLTKDLAPKNVIERCWVRDIAVMTARLDFMRRAHWTVMACAMEDIALAEAREGTDASGGKHQDEVGAQEDLLALVRRMAEGQDLAQASRDPRIQRLMSKALAQHFALSEQFLRLEIGIARERDRVMALQDRRRMMQLSEALDLIEDGMLKGVRAIEDQSDGQDQREGESEGEGEGEGGDA